MKETIIQSLPVPVKKSGRAGFSRRTRSNCPMLPAECKAEEHSHTTGTPAHECGYELENERLPRRVSIREETRSRTLEKNKSVIFMECETDKIASADEATRGVSVQQIIFMLEHNIHKHAKHSKRIPKKPMVQRALKQTLDKIKSYSLRTTTENNPTHEERRTYCTHQCKECSNQFI